MPCSDCSREEKCPPCPYGEETTSNSHDALLMRVSDDSVLEQRLKEQKRPQRPSSLREAREQMEGYIARSLEGVMSPPEARVEAVRVMAWFENYAGEESYRRGFANGFSQARSLED